MRWIIFLITLLPCSLQAKSLAVPVEAQGAILINGRSGTLLYEKHSNSVFYPASITKIATALYILHIGQDRLEEKVVAKADALASISPEAKRQSKYRAPPYFLETDSSHMGIKKGEEFRLLDLLYAMLLRSANDSANVLAEHFGGTIPHFMDGMNAYLNEIGCKKTRFLNPHGLHHPDHVTTPHDMALIAKEAMKNPLFREIVSNVHYTVPETNLSPERYLLQTNLLLRSGHNFYPRAIGIKTGTSTAAGKTLVAAAEEPDGRMLIAVVMGYQGKGDRYEDVTKLFQAAFNEPKCHVSLLPAGLQKMAFKISHGASPLKISLDSPLEYDYFPTEKMPVKVKMKWHKKEPLIKKGEQVGTLVALDAAGEVMKEVPCFAFNEVKPRLFYRFAAPFVQKKRALFIGATLSFSALFFIIFLKKRRKKTHSSY